jgi:heme/copper-type cytochrome/quinol oxidase subunit 1
LSGAILQGLIRLTISAGIASGIALLVDHFLDRSAALGFYIVGAALLAVAFSTSSGMSGRMGGWYMYHAVEGRERRFNLGVAYIAAGAVVVGIGVAIEALTGR